MTPGQIGACGERIVEAVLVAEGWECKRNTQQPGSTDIEAHKESQSFLVQVKTGVYPNNPPLISEDEVRNIRSRATRLGYEAWQANLQISPLGQLVGTIEWIHLG
jgi:hypothetical protein